MKGLQLSSLEAAAMLASLLPSVANAALYDTVIETQYGNLTGAMAFDATTGARFSNWKDVSVWKGIPFAASTAGENR
jgi:carboxylesterase 2